MTLVEHIYELRHRLTVAILAVLAGGVLGFLWFQSDVFGLPSLGTLLTDPYCALPRRLRADITPNGECQLLATAPFEAFMLQMKVGLTAGAVLTSPVWLYQLWSFITPALYHRERRYAMTFVTIAVVLFTVGAVLAYLIVSKGLEVLLGFGGGQVITALTGDKYFSFMIRMLLVFGVSFELPLLVIMLNRVGVISYAKLVKWWRGLIFGLCVFAALATPADPISMIALSIALSLLFFAALMVCKVQDGRRARRLAADGMDAWDDEVEELDKEVAEELAEQKKRDRRQGKSKPAPPQYDDVT